MTWMIWRTPTAWKAPFVNGAAWKCWSEDIFIGQKLWQTIKLGGSLFQTDLHDQISNQCERNVWNKASHHRWMAHHRDIFCPKYHWSVHSLTAKRSWCNDGWGTVIGMGSCGRDSRQLLVCTRKQNFFRLLHSSIIVVDRSCSQSKW